MTSIHHITPEPLTPETTTTCGVILTPTLIGASDWEAVTCWTCIMRRPSTATGKLVKAPKLPVQSLEIGKNSPYVNFLQAVWRAGATEFCATCYAYVTPEHPHRILQDEPKPRTRRGSPVQGRSPRLAPVPAHVMPLGDPGDPGSS